MATHIDIIDGSRGRESRNGWEEVERVATVTGCTGSGQAKLANALSASGMPGIGSGHPAFANLALEERAPEAIGTDTVKVRLIYRRSDPPSDPASGTIEVGASLNQQQTDRDYAGDLITVTHADIVQGGIVNVLRPQVTITRTRKELSSPGAKAKTYVGKLNSGAWSLDPGASARQWLCTGITGRSDDNGASYEVTYTFQYDENAWWEKVVWIDPATGRPPNPLDATGEKTVQLYDEVDFSQLQL